MPDPILLPSLAVLTGSGVLVARDYLRRRLEGAEDRYMALYGQEVWDASNMDLTLHCDPRHDAALKAAFRERLAAFLASDAPEARLLREEVDPYASALSFLEDDEVSAARLEQPRRGVYLDMGVPGQVRVVWNHMQVDGVGMWSALRPLFDPNPAIVPFREVPIPPPLIPELLALPRLVRRLGWRGRLGREAGAAGAPLHRGLSVWDAGPIRALKDQTGGAFNLVTSALALAAVFRRHPEKDSLNVGVTAYFPFLEGRNRYTVFLCRVRRAPINGLLAQLHRQVRSPLLNWGTSAAQAYALGRVPDRLFSQVVGYYRRQIDVLISSLPVGAEPVTLAGVPTTIACHPWELTLPYYFLLVGTRAELHVSWTSRFGQDPDTFLALESLSLRG